MYAAKANLTLQSTQEENIEIKFFDNFHLNFIQLEVESSNYVKKKKQILSKKIEK